VGGEFINAPVLAANQSVALAVAVWEPVALTHRACCSMKLSSAHLYGWSSPMAARSDYQTRQIIWRRIRRAICCSEVLCGPGPYVLRECPLRPVAQQTNAIINASLLLR